MSTPDNKGYDDSPPRNGVIFFYTVLTVFVLVGVKFLLDSYFVKTMESEVHDKVLTRGMAEVANMRAKEKETLAHDGLEAAMKTLAQRGRTASPLIVPQSGQGKAEVPGWSKLPHGSAPEAAAPTGTAPNQAAATPVTPEPGESPHESQPNANPAGHGH